jgi:hypothetical protein
MNNQGLALAAILVSGLKLALPASARNIYYGINNYHMNNDRINNQTKKILARSISDCMQTSDGET